MKMYFCKNIIAILFLSVGIAVYGQENTIQKTYSWKIDAQKDVEFTFHNYDCALVIHTWDQPEIKYQMFIDASLKTEDDAQRLDTHIEDLEFKHSSGFVLFNNRFWTSRKNMVGKKTIELKGKKTIRYTDFNMKGELWIPANANFNLESKYSGIELEDMLGRVSLDLYNDKFFGGDVANHLTIKAKYSTLELEDVDDIEADLYNTDVEAGDVGNLNIGSKYSKFKAGNTGRIDINGYNDKFHFGNTEDIKFVDKYSDLTAKNSGNIEVDCYNSTIIFTSVKDAELMSKYSKYEIDRVNDISITSSYTDSYKIGYLKALNIRESKYGSYKIEELSNSISLNDSYSCKYQILKTGPDFKRMKVSGKYVNIEMALAADFDFRFKADVKYPKFDILEESMDVIEKIKESSQLKMKAIKGSEKEGMPEIIIEGYDMALTFTEQ